MSPGRGGRGYTDSGGHSFGGGGGGGVLVEGHGPGAVDCQGWGYGGGGCGYMQHGGLPGVILMEITQEGEGETV